MVKAPKDSAPPPRLTMAYCKEQQAACAALAAAEAIAPVRVMLDHIGGTWQRIAHELKGHQ